MMFTSLLKAATAIALTPVSLAVDLVCMPSDAYDGDNFAPRTRDVVKAAKNNFRNALKPEE